MTFCRADEVAAWAGIATAAVRQAAAKAKLIEILIIMTITRNERGNVNAREGLSVPHKLVAWVPHSQPFWPLATVRRNSCGSGKVIERHRGNGAGIGARR